MGDVGPLCPLRHAIDVTTNVAVTESSQRTILQVAIVGKKFKAWLTVVAGCNRLLGLSDIASLSRKALTRLRKSKKEPPSPAAQGFTGRRQTEWTGATQCPERWTRPSNDRESLITR